MKTVSLKLPEALDIQLKTLARKRGVTRSEVVREALALYVSRGAANESGSCLNLTRDLAGSVEGPSDLSTNRSHMEDYGR